MKRAAPLLVLVMLVTSCATMQGSGGSPVSRALEAAGGAEALAGVKTVYEKGTSKFWEPEQSMVPGGEMRFANESSFEAITDVASGTTGIDWSRKITSPARQFTFTEIVTPDVGYVWGIDSFSRTKQSQESTPPAHNMSALRLAAAHRELRRTSPLLLLQMAKNPTAVAPAADVTVGTVTYPAVAYRPTANQAFTVMFDRATGLPARIRTLDDDNIWGDVTYDLVLSDWQARDGGVKVAMARTYELNGRTVVETRLTDVKLNGSYAADRIAIPEAFRTSGSKPATGYVPYQWVIRRQFIGFYLDSDAPSYDTRATSGLKLVDVGKGVVHVAGGSHNSLIVEMKDHLVVFDAPVSDWQSLWTLAAAQYKFPKKPVKYLVLTHHHMDHAGGLRAYADQGATLVVGKGAAEHYRRVLAAPATRNPDLPPRDLTRTPIIEVADKHVLSDGQREVHAYLVTPNPHADGLLIGYVPDVQVGFVTDIWNPGVGPAPETLNPMLASLVSAVKKAGIQPTKFAGGHGGVADYAPIAALEAK